MLQQISVDRLATWCDMNHNAREVKRLHRIAMEYADEADLAKLFGERDKYLRLMKKAFEKEKAAADLMADIHVEPSRGVLHRSAATLAWLCGMYVEAEKLIYRALAGNPRSDIEWELKDLLAKVEAALEDAAPVPQPEPATAP